MAELMENIKRCMIEHGNITDKYRINLVEITGNKNSDYRQVIVEVIKPKCHKPFMVWNFSIDIVKELLFWETSTFYYL